MSDDTLRSGSVVGLSPSPPTVTVAVAGTQVPNVGYNTDTYTPQVGDSVIVAKIADQLWVLQSMTPNRSGASSVSVVNAAPGAGWSSIASTYVASGVTANPAVQFVLTTPVTPPTTLAVHAITSGVHQVGTAPEWPPTHRLAQGAYTAPGLTITYTGLWIYSGLAAALSGLTITRVQLTVAVSTTGRSPVQLHLYEHNLSALPTSGAPTITGPAFSPTAANVVLGSTTTFDLPLSWAADFKAGTQKGIAISSTSPSDFIELLGVDESSASGVLTFTH